jgi:hypothetical protein
MRDNVNLQHVAKLLRKQQQQQQRQKEMSISPKFNPRPHISPKQEKRSYG